MSGSGRMDFQMAVAPIFLVFEKKVFGVKKNAYQKGECFSF